jgi:hypothetical protein
MKHVCHYGRHQLRFEIGASRTQFDGCANALNRILVTSRPSYSRISDWNIGLKAWYRNRISWFFSVTKGKKVKSLCLSKHHAMKPYWGVEV